MGYRLPTLFLVLLSACAAPTGGANDPNAPDLRDLLDGGPAAADAATAQDNDGGPSDPEPVAQRYAMKAVSAVLQRNPSPLGNEEVQVLTTQLMLVESRRLGDDFRWTETLCSIATSEARYAFGLRATTSYPEAFVDTFPRFERQGLWTEAGEFSAGPMVSLVGAVLDAPRSDPLPTEAGSGGEFDGDGDGHPGVTVEVGGAVSGSVYVAQRSIITTRGRQRDGGRIEGLWQSQDEQVVLGASRDILNSQVERRRDPDAAASYFIMVPVEGSLNCDAINGRHDELF